jgi:putative ABC transport system permease protein
LQHPVGSRVSVDDWFAKKAFTIIGVVKDFNHGSLKRMIQPIILALNDGTDGTVVIKIDKQRQKSALHALEKVYRSAVPGAEYTYAFWDELNARQYQLERKWQQIINVATILSVLICCLGLFGLSNLAARTRIKEIGIRKVLGASVSGIASLISKEFLLLVLVSIIIAAPVAWYFMNKWLLDFAYRITIQWWMFAAAGFASLVIALITVSFHAIKAALQNPVKNLRTE